MWRRDMLFREIMEFLVRWKNNPEKKALLITGARQIGKTYIVRAFGKEYYEHFVEINMITEPKAMLIFEGSLDADTLISNITAYTRRPLIPGKTLIFFDEIQECPNARTAIKFLVEDGRFDYIESGSLLGVNYKEVKSYPVGYEEQLQMYPLCFREFAIALGVQHQTFELLEKCYKNKTRVSDVIHQKMLELFQYYIIVGGMPAAVWQFVQTHDIGDVIRVQKDILNLYRQDISKYALRDKTKIKDIFDNIPSQLNNENRRFLLSSLTASARMERYQESFLWLSDAGVALPCYNITEPKAPLQLSKKSNLFKLFLSDTGLLCAASMENVQFDILKGNLSINMGSILENVFAQQFNKKGFLLYYMNKKKLGEIDFILQQGGDVVPIEIKSGNDYKKHSALNSLLLKDGWNVKQAYVFCKGNVSTNNSITYMPWYMILYFLQESHKDLKVNIDIANI